MIAILRPVAIGLVGAFAVGVAQDHPTRGPLIVAVVAVVVAAGVFFRERGLAIAAVGVGAAGAFVAPDGLGPLLVAAGVVVACDLAAVDGRLAEWSDVLDAAVALPALAGLLGTVAAQPSYRGIALAVVTVAGAGVSTWRGSRRVVGPRDLVLVPGLGCIAAFVVAFAPDQITGLGDLPSATVQAARSLAAALAIVAVVMLAGLVQAERGATLTRTGTRYRR